MFDSHCHLDFEELAPGLDEHLRVARDGGVRGWFVPGCSPEQWPNLTRVKRAGVFVGVGLHPYFTTSDTSPDELCSQIEVECRSSGAVALGECGLDKGRGADVEVQVRVLEAQLCLARELDLPVVLHQVGLRDQFLACLTRAQPPAAGGVVHGFGGDTSWGRALITRGLMLGIGPAITRPNRVRLRAAASQLPLTRLLIETDAPDQRLEGAMGPGVPRDLVSVCRTLAELRGCEPEVIARGTEGAARELYRLF